MNGFGFQGVPGSVIKGFSAEIGDKAGGNYFAIDENGQIRLYGNATQWDDLRFPFVGTNIDTSTGRIDYNYFNGGIDFQANAYEKTYIRILKRSPAA